MGDELLRKIAELAEEHELHGCFECGKCNAICPLYDLFDDLDWRGSPRSIVEAGLDERDLTNGDAIWYCLQCDACTAACPCEVGIRDFIAGVRALALEAGRDEHVRRCVRCGDPFAPLTTLEAIARRTADQGDPPALLEVCPRCRTREFSKQARWSLGNLPVDDAPPGEPK
jgi:Fe-S oxidoreductase